MRTKHTEGEWKVVNGLTIVNHEGDEIAKVKHYNSEYLPTSNADAKLIAAAPDLLKALERVAVTYRDLSAEFLANGNKHRARIYENEMFLFEDIIKKATQ